MTIATEIAALADRTTAELAAQYESLFGRPARYRNPVWLRKRIAFKLQENAFGGLSRVAHEALDKLQADIALPAAPRPATEQAHGELRVGTVLQREWRGQQIRVEVTKDGFVHGDITYGSLSAVAFAITGARWNGRLFFNLVERKRA